MNRNVVLSASLVVLASIAERDIVFDVKQIDSGMAESTAIADVNRDGKPDIISAGSWYEAPIWSKHRIRDVPVSSGYVDSFSDLPIDVDGDGFVDVIQVGYFARRLVWMKNPGRTASGEWTENLIDAVGPTEFAFLVDLDNDGRARELLPQFTAAANAPLCWYELLDGKWIKHLVSDRSYGHGIGVGDLSGDGRNDILTPIGWLEAPANVRNARNWTFHPQPWNTRPLASPITGPAPRPLEFGFMYVLDLNGDRRSDLLSTDGHNYGIYWFEQKPDGAWERHEIDRTFSESHSSVLIDFNGDGQPELVTGKRFQARNQSDPGVAELLVLYWYEFRKTAAGPVEWTRHPIAEGSRMGTGLQLRVVDIDGDGGLDVVAAGKSGLFIATRRPAVASK